MSSAAANLSSMSRLGVLRPVSTKLMWREVTPVTAARSSWLIRRCRRPVCRTWPTGLRSRRAGCVTPARFRDMKRVGSLRPCLRLQEVVEFDPAGQVVDEPDEAREVNLRCQLEDRLGRVSDRHRLGDDVVVNL